LLAECKYRARKGIHREPVKSTVFQMKCVRRA
jgi:hypothetical protein